MMDLAAPHIGFVLASYAVSFAGLAALIVATVARDRKLAHEAVDLEARRDGGK